MPCKSKKIRKETLTKGNKAKKRDRKRISNQKWERQYQKSKKKKRK